MTQINPNVKSSVSALMKEYHTITHNIANANTVGFKRRVSAFSKALHQQQSRTSGAKSNNEIIKDKTTIDFSQGNFQQTGKKLDLAIAGKGFFVIETPNGELYTRNGQFSLNDKNQIVDVQGRLLAGTAGPITIPANVSQTEISIGPSGALSAQGVVLGNIRMVEFPDDDINKLMPVGENCFVAHEDLIAENAANSSVQQGYCESSNVNTISETINLISVSRMYEANMSVLTKSGETSKAILDVAMA